MPKVADKQFVKHAGFGFVELLGAMSVGLIVIYALGMQMTALNRSVHLIQAKMEGIRASQEVMMFMTSTPQCDASLAGLTGVATPSNGPTNNQPAVTDITNQIANTTNPLNIFKTNYSTNNNYLDITGVELFIPATRLFGGLNNATPFDVQIRFKAKEKSLNGQAFYVNGPYLSVNIDTTTNTVAAVNPCQGLITSTTKGPIAGSTPSVPTTGNPLSLPTCAVGQVVTSDGTSLICTDIVYAP